MSIRFTRLVNQLRLDEGVKDKPYLDTEGNWSIGVGRNLTANGLIPREIDFLLMNDIDRVISELDKNIPFFVTFDDVRQEVLVNMCFNLGISRFMAFKKMIAALQKQNFKLAAAEMKDSKWFTQVGNRAIRLCRQMETGVY